MKIKKLVMIVATVIITFTICAIAAMYTPPNFGHSVNMLTKNGGICKHPVLLGFNEDKYVVFVTGTVKAPYKGSAKVVLEGDPKIEYKIYSQYPPDIKLGIHKFHGFKNNTIEDLTPWEKFALAVVVKPQVKIDKTSNYKLRFYDVKSNNVVLSIPITFMELDNFHIKKTSRRPNPNAHATVIKKIIPDQPVTKSTNKPLPALKCCEE